MSGKWILIAICAGLGLGAAGSMAAWGWRRRREQQQRAAWERCRQAFHQRREWLEAAFHKAANLRGTPRGLTWSECDFEDGVEFARDRQSNQPMALVGVTIKFEAIEGGGMEEVEAVANRKAATAVFRYAQDGWTTEGRAVFNLSPSETIDYYHAELERLVVAPAGRASVSSNPTRS